MSDAAIANVVTGIVTITITIVGFLTLWIKLRYGVEKTEEANKKVGVVESKIDSNTILTMAAGEAAAKGAATAVKSANESKAATAEIAKKLNGGIDSAVAQAMDPVNKILKDHADKIETLNRYVHERNHDLLTALQTQTNKLELILRRLDGDRK